MNADLIMLVLEYDKAVNRFFAARQDIPNFELPEGDFSYIAAQDVTGFLVKYRKIELGTIKARIERDRNFQKAFYLGVFEPDRDYGLLYPEMKNALVKQSKEDMEAVAMLSKAIEEAEIGGVI